MSFFLAIEGADGAGKGTASAAVVAALSAQGVRAALVSFPRYTETAGGFAIGEFLAGRLPRTVTPQAAAVLYALDRFESRGHLDALAAANDVVVFDRYATSNMAYQGAQVPADAAQALMDWVWRLETESFALRPADLTIYLDTPADLARRFIGQKALRSYTERTFDDYEADEGLQARVRANYARLAAEQAQGAWQVVATAQDGEPRPPMEIAAQIVAAYRAISTVSP